MVSNIIHDRKADVELSIVDCSDNCADVTGGKKILIFCEKVVKDDIEVRFDYTDEGGLVHTLHGNFTPSQVHKQYGIAFTTPAFTSQRIVQKVQAEMYLYKRSTSDRSNSIDFYFLPKDHVFTPPNAKIQQIMPAQPSIAKVNNLKRTKEKPVNLEQDESSRMKEIRPKYQATGGGSVQVAEDVKPLFTETVLSQKDISGFFKLEPGSSDMLPPTSGFSGDLSNLSDFNPGFFENLDSSKMKNLEKSIIDISDDVSSMKIEGEEPKNSASLQTPNVSMEVSGRKAHQNNLDG